MVALFDEIKESYLATLRRYAVFHGRARRREYWYFGLVNVFAIVLLDLIVRHVPLIGGLVLFLIWLFWAAILIPSLAVSVRRLHDTERSGWWLLIALVPLVGAIALLIFFVIDGTPGANRYGPDPKSARLIA